MQSRINKLYYKQMFDHTDSLNSKECCYVVINLLTNSEHYSKHSIRFYMPRSERETFIREFEEFDGFSW